MIKTGKRLSALLLTALLLLMQCAALSADGEATEDVVFLVDCSGSMTAEDAGRSAAVLYRGFLNDCDHAQTRVGLVCFTNYLEYTSGELLSIAEDAGLQNALNAAEQIRYGTNDTDVALGLREAARMLEESSAEQKTIILIGDGVTDLPRGPRTKAESLKEQAELVEKLAAMNVKIDAVCMNAAGGANPDAIREIARETGGALFDIRSNAEVEGVLDAILERKTDNETGIIPAVDDGAFYTLFGSLLERFETVETTGELQTIENSFSMEQLDVSVPVVPAPELTDSLPTDGNTIRQTLDTLAGITEQLGDLRDAVRSAGNGDLGALDDIGTKGTAGQGTDVPSTGPQFAAAPESQMRTAEQYELYLVLHSEGMLQDLKLFQTDAANPTVINEITEFYDLGSGYRAVSLSQLPAGWSDHPVYLELRGEAGQTAELMLLNLSEINVTLSAERALMKPGETQTVVCSLTARGVSCTALMAEAEYMMTLSDPNTGESRAAEGVMTEQGCAFTVGWPTEVHLKATTQVRVTCGGLSLVREAQLGLSVCENPITARSERTQYFLLLCGMKGTGGLAKTFRMDKLLENSTGKQLQVMIYPTVDTVLLQNGETTNTLSVTSMRAFALSRFNLIISDSFNTVLIPCVCFSVPLLLAVCVLVLLLGIVGLCLLASYMKKHTKFIGKLFLKFRLPPEMSELAIQDSELIFPYTNSITLWELIIVNSSMHLAMTPILQNSELEHVAKSIRIQSWGKNELRIKAAGLEDVLPQSEAGDAKNTVIAMGEDDSIELSVPAGNTRMSVTLYRNPNTVKQSVQTFTKTKKQQTLDEKTESARQRLSAISEEVADTAAKQQEAEADSFGTQESINCFVFANMLGMLKLDKDQNTVKLYRDAVDFSPVTLIDAGIIDSNLYYDVYRSFCRKLDRQRRESLGTQMRELLAACADDREKAERVEKQTRSMLLSYTAMMRGVMDFSEGPTRGAEESAQAAAFYGKVVDVCKQLLGKLEV